MELFLNWRSLGKGKRSTGLLFTLPGVAWQPGTLRAVATSADGRKSEGVVETIGAPVALRLTPRTGPRGFVMDGADIAVIEVEVIDAKGRSVPTANDKVAFAGPAEWRAGMAQGDSSGKPRVTVAKAEKDTVRLTATAPGLKAATLLMPTVAAAKVEDGLSRSLADVAQPGLLTREPTPATPSYRVSRTTPTASSIVAGSNQAAAGRSVDDNELTHWVSDGTAATAQIAHRFANPARLSEIELKLVSWRSRAYPLRITRDGKQMWTGETDRQPRCATIAFAPATSTVLRLTRTAPTQDRDAFGKIVELGTARQSGGTGAEAVAPGWCLAIVEADFHGPVAL